MSSDAYIVLQGGSTRPASELLTAQAGVEWHVGNGAPANDIGKDGDLYLDRETTNIYEKEGGSWA